jgi:hypothetical protein
MFGRWLGAAWTALAALAAGGALQCARAETVTLDFDPPGFQAGQALGRVADIGFFGSPQVFQPSGVATQSPPLALHTPAWCDSPACPAAGFGLSMILYRPATRLSVRLGSEAPPPSASFCFPEGTDCGVWARLVGTHDGVPIADSRDVKLYDAGTGQAPITHELSVSDPSGRINGAVIWVGRGTFAHDGDNNPGRVQLDHLVVDFVDGAPPPPPPLPSAPTVQITGPFGPLSAPYRFQVTGNFTATGGLYALCLRLNEAVPTSEAYCANNVVFGTGGSENTFTAQMFAPSLLPTGNVVNTEIFDLAGQSSRTSFPLQAAPPPPPSISLSTPRPGVWTPTPTTASGFVVTSGRPAGFCVRTSLSTVYVPAPALADCQDQRFVDNGGNFAGVPITLSPGVQDVWGFVYDAFGQVGHALVQGTVPGNLRITGVEIGQGSQILDAPNTSSQYGGVQLVQDLPTVVRVFGGASSGGPFPNVNATLQGFYQDPHSGETLLGTLMPDNGTVTLAAGPPVAPLDQRADPDGGFVFTLPSDWTDHGAIRLEAKINVVGFGPTYPECAGCDGDDVVDVTNIGFRQPFAQAMISPIALRWTDNDGVMHEPDDPETVFQVLRALAPFTPQNLTIQPYQQVIDVDVDSFAGGVAKDGTCDNSCGQNLVAITADIALLGQQGSTIGISTAVVRGWTTLEPVGLAWQEVSIASTSTAFAEPLKLQVAHEIFHQFHYLHASGACFDAATQPWEPWPPDQHGRMQGMGLDRRPDSGGQTGTYWVAVDRDPPNDAYDIMSYCAPGHPSWLSPHNWSHLGQDLPFFNALCTKDLCTQGMAAPGNSASRVMAAQGADGRWAILNVRRLDGPAALRSKAAPTLRFIGRDRSGVVVTSALAEAHQGFDRGTAQLAVAELPAVDLGSIALEVDGKEVARRTASAHAPSVELVPLDLKPDIHTGQVRVNWRTADADGDRVGVRVDYAEDGKRFHTIGWSGHPGGMNLPLRLFSASKTARLRLVASDGMNEASVISAPFVSPGEPPDVEILEPANDLQMRSTGVLNLTGQGFDDRGQPIPGKDLRWTLDGAPWGESGYVRTLIQPSPGRHVITLTGKDRFGRATLAQRTVEVVDGGMKPTHPAPILKPLAVTH